MRLYGIIGYPIAHSRSPEYFNELFRREGLDARYLPFELEDIHGLPALLDAHPDLCGFNVTIPHKTRILPYLDNISAEAAAVGAVNCVRIERTAGSPHLYGYNTDVQGFRKALEDFLPTGIRQAVILGDGGAAKAVRYVLHTLRIPSVTVSRTPKGEGRIAYSELPAFLSGEGILIVNATPLGTYPRISECPPIPYHLLTPRHYLFDLVYNPEETEFMKRGKAAGSPTCNGYAMLLNQAKENRKIWGF